MTARFATPEEIKTWNQRLINNPDGGNIFSSVEYTELKKRHGYRPLFVVVDDLAITVLEKKTFLFGNLWYLPKGPGTTTIEELQIALKSLRELARKNNVFALRIEPEIAKEYSSNLNEFGYKASKAIIPNPSTITLNIAPPSEEILASLPQKGRHAIKRAQRDGVTIQRVSAANPSNRAIMFSLLSGTAEGQFSLRPESYYHAFWETFEASHSGQLFFAYFNDEVVAAAYALSLGKKSTYKDGASIRKKTAYGASHLLQWEVIQWAKEQGANVHDLCGSPPLTEINNTEHPHYGVGRFKLSLSKNVIDYIGCYDVPLKPLSYTLWRKVGERIYQRIYHLKTKDFYF